MTAVADRVPHPSRADVSGMTVVVTRPVGAAERLLAALRAAGARPLHFPTVALYPAAPGSIAAALTSRWDWVVLTSANGAAALRGHPPPPSRVAAVGPATASALREQGWPVDWVPARASGADVARGLPLTPGERVLLLRSDAADPALAAALAARGASVEDVAVYRTRPRQEPWPDLRLLLEEGGADALLLASPSAVEGLLNACGGDAAFCRRAALVSIGPTTSTALRRAGLTPDAEAETPDADGLVEALGRLGRSARVGDR